MRSLGTIGTGTKICAVIGNPVEHSLSPAIHNAAYAELDLDFVYVAFRVEDLKSALAGMRALENFRGLSVTIPHKLEALKYLDAVEDVDRRIGSINTVVNDGGTLTGLGTDGPGALKAIAAAGVEIDGKRVLLLGAGGAARAIAFTLASRKKPAEIMVLDVDAGVLEKLKADLEAGTEASVRAERMTEGSLAAADGDRRPHHSLHSGRHVPEDRCLPGPGPALPARPGRLRHRLHPPRDETAARRTIARAAGDLRSRHVRQPGGPAVRALHRLRRPRRGDAAGRHGAPAAMNLVLIGYRGTGKTAVGRLLAERLGMTYVGMDAEIVDRAGLSIPEIVAQRGWPGFRDLESALAVELAARDGLVIDTGGGIIERPENIEALKRKARIFWLKASVDVIVARIRDDTQRPALVAGKTFTEEIAEVLERRTPRYSAAAHHAIDTDALSPGQIADRIAGICEAQAR